MRIALVYPGKQEDTKQMPLGIGYLASYILSKNDDVEVKALDTGIATEKETRAFYSGDYDVVGISVTSRGYHEAVQLARTFKENHKHTLVVFGGPHVSLMMQEIMQEQLIDVAVYGEAELTFDAFLKALKETGQQLDSEALSKINGLIYRSNGKTVVTPRREFIKALDTLPFPAFHLFPMERYPGKYPMITSRGCPFACVFCAASHIWQKRWRARSPEDVIEEVEYLTKHFKARPIDFHDAIFNTSLKRVNRICDLFINKKIKIPWGVRGFRADIIDFDTAKKMSEAGCTHVAIGIESANPEMLIGIGKKETIEQIDKGIDILRANGIDVLGQFMIGNPGETLETVKESITYAKGANLTQVVFGTAVPFPNTGLWSYVHEHGRFLVEADCTRFEEISPRVIFETSEFSKKDRLEAIRLASKAGFLPRGSEKIRLGHKLLSIGSDIWFKYIYKHLPRSISYVVYTILRRVKRRLKS
jgi:radical SAM superfamily enzyme YgiQ (UPF0313 family)